jgi:hypothetical protein
MVMNYLYRRDRKLHSHTDSLQEALPPDLETNERHPGRASLARLLALAACVAAIWGASGCAGGTPSANLSTQTPIILVSISQSPPAYMTVSTTTQVAAVVTNDVANAGVDWVAACNSSNCGTFNPSHTGPGQNTSYTAPGGVPPTGKVSVTALSTTDRSKAAVVGVAILSTVTGITFTAYPPAFLPAGALVSLGAAVAGDPANLGVDWTATCNTANGPVTCSTSGLHSAAGGTVFFVVPQTITVPGTVQSQSLIGTSITVTGYATADHKFFTLSIFTVTGPITISITQQPPATMLTNATASVAAVVTNDTTNAGVTWIVDCVSSPCGTITPSQSASGVVATFTAPPVVPSPNPPPGLQVTITAYSTAGGTSVQSTVTVNIVAPIAVKITQGITNKTIVQNASAPLAATVANDSANAGVGAGVDWTVTCGSPGACGSFSPTHTASAAQTTYTAPNAVPAGGTVVTIIATSTTDPTKNDQQSVNVTSAPPPNSLLQGQFVLSLSARNSQNGPYVLGGVISGDGNPMNGKITGGVVDLADGAGNATPAAGVPIISPSTYSIGLDGRGQIHLTISTFSLNTHFGVPGAPNTGTISLAVIFVTPQHARLAEIDAFGSGIGTLDRQNATDLASFRNGSIGLNGTYSLQLSGTQAVSPYPGYFLTSAMAIQASGTSYTLTGYTTDQSAAGAIMSVPFASVSQVFPPGSAPDSNGEISTSLGGINLGPAKFSLDLWIIDATHFVVTDYRDPALGNPNTNILIIGSLTAQPASASLSGTYAFTEAGASTASQPLVAGGILTCGSTGTLDVFPLAGTVVSNQSISSTCSAPANGRGLISISGAGSSGISQFAAYPTVDRGVYLIELDGGTAGTSGPSGAGAAFQQTLSTPISSSALKGNYATVFSASTALGSENFTAQVIPDGVSNLSGTADVTSFNTTTAPPSATPSLGASLTGPFTTISNGRFPSTLTLTPASGQPTPQITVLHPAFYLVDASTCLLLGLDGNAPGTGIMQLQNTGL